MSSGSDEIPIIIDNGSYECRVGFAPVSTEPPQPLLTFKNILAKNRANRKIDRDWELQVGNEIKDIEALRWMIKSPFDLDVVVNFTVQELLLDYAFENLPGLKVDEAAGGVAHPVVMTEAIANPPQCRKNMSELLIEAYSVPKVAYGIDCLFSLHHNEPVEHKTALIVSSGFQTTHVVPVVSGVADLTRCQRLNLGGYNCSAYLQRLLHLRNPQVSPAFFSLSLTEKILQSRGRVAVDYSAEAAAYSGEITSGAAEPSMLHIGEKFLEKDAPSPAVSKLMKLIRSLERQLCDVEALCDVINGKQQQGDNVDKSAAAAASIRGSTDCKALEEQSRELARKLEAAEAKHRLQLEAEQLKVKKEFATELCIDTSLVERQAAEIIFQPSLVGYRQCGLSACVENVLKSYTDEHELQRELAANVFVTGGNTRLRGFSQRLQHDIRGCRPSDHPVCIHMATNPSGAAWSGAAAAASSGGSLKWMTAEDFKECGWEYLQEHRFSNKI